MLAYVGFLGWAWKHSATRQLIKGPPKPKPARATVGAVNHRLIWANRNAGWRYRCTCGWIDPNVRWTERNAIGAGNAHIRQAMRRPAPGLPARSPVLAPLPPPPSAGSMQLYGRSMEGPTAEIEKALRRPGSRWDANSLTDLQAALYKAQGRFEATVVPSAMACAHTQLIAGLADASRLLVVALGHVHAGRAIQAQASVQPVLDRVSAAFAAFNAAADWRTG